MKQNWFVRHFGWISDDFRRLTLLLTRRDTWLFLGIVSIFAILIYYGFHFALGLDFSLRLRKLIPFACREIGNLDTTFLFFGAIFLALTLTMVFGEFTRHLDFKRHHAHAQARVAAKLCAGWCVFALVIGVALVIFLKSQCL